MSLIVRPSRVVLVALLTMGALHAPRAAAEPSPPLRTFAARAGWAYGLGLELEYRPRRWGVGVSGGYVPGYGPGGYVGVQWGLHPLTRSGLVAEAGVFRGIHNPLRVADTGLGLYALGGYALVARGRYSMRGAVGGGLPLGDADHPVSFEFLAKLTAGLTF